MKYRTKPIYVDATQWFPGVEIAGVNIDHGGHYVIAVSGHKDYLLDGDWVITEPDGVHFHACRPDIFDATYEPA